MFVSSFRLRHSTIAGAACLAAAAILVVNPITFAVDEASSLPTSTEAPQSAPARGVGLGPCPGDANGDGTVSFADIFDIIGNFGPYAPCPPHDPLDLNQNCNIDFADILLVIANFGPCPALLDAWATPDDTVNITFFEFGTPEHPALPADYFYPGSDPFTGQVSLYGEPLSGQVELLAPPLNPFTGITDTVVERKAQFLDPIGPEVVPIEIVALNLRSADPIDVSGGEPDQLWEMYVTLSDVPAGQGNLQTNPSPINPNSGTFGASVPINPLFVFARSDELQQAAVGLIPPEGVQVRLLDWPLEGLTPLNVSFEPTSFNPYVRQVDPPYQAFNDLFIFPNPPLLQSLGFVPGLFQEEPGGELFKPGPMKHVTPGEAHYVAPPNNKPGGQQFNRCEYIYSGVSILVNCGPVCPPAPPLVKGRLCPPLPCRPILLRIVRCAGGGICIQIYHMPVCVPC
ncbi:MAG: hypothetical protein GY715_01120 [Planctomycetes bacterium]|nr:hypothetical protein [Planctomycetota bacterium]